MKTLNFLFISTNNMWSGSEELWFALANNEYFSRFHIYIATYYSNDKIEKLIKFGVKHFDLNNRFQNQSRIKSVIRNLIRKKEPKDLFETFLKENDIDFVIVSQGNNISSLDVLNIVNGQKLPFCTITQLVAEMHQLFLTYDSFAKLRDLYKLSLANFFVSKHNLFLHEQMMALPNASNNFLTFNPFRFQIKEIDYPKAKDSYNLAYVGRIEFYHKGLDLLLKVLQNPKWQSRNLKINCFGDGPHKGIMRERIVSFGLTNIVLHDFVEDVSIIWQKNQGLILLSRMEGQSLALIEACYYKRMVITTNVGDAQELIIDGKSGFLADYANEYDIDRALERAWAYRDDWENIGKQAFKLIQENRKSFDVVDELSIKIIQLQNSYTNKK